MKLSKPQNLDAERAVLKCLLSEPELFYEIGDQLRPEMFFGLDNALVYKYFSTLFGNGKTPDYLLIKNSLEKKDQFTAIGGEAYFKELERTEALMGNFDEYVKFIANTFISRQIIDIGTAIQEAGFNKPIAQAIDTVYTESTKILDLASSDLGATNVTDLMLKEFEAFLERLRNPGGDGLLTSFPDYDSLSGGLHTTDQVIVAARPSVGKTSLSLRLMLNLAKQGHPCLLYSYEMSERQLMQRFLSMESEVALSKIRNGMVAADEYEQVAAAADFIGTLPVYISNNVGATVLDIATETKKMVRTKGICAVFVDYIQLMPYRVELATQDLGNISRQLKNLAVTTDIIVVLVSQLNRLVEMRTVKVPLLSDLRQSGNLEEHADVVLMLYREEMYDPTEENRGKADLLIRKNRNGPIGKLPLLFRAQTVDFRSAIWE